MFSIRRNGDGFIDREEFGEILRLTGEPVTEEDVDEMFGDSDNNKDGKIDFDGKDELSTAKGNIWAKYNILSCQRKGKSDFILRCTDIFSS